MRTPIQILDDAIQEYQPKQIICLFSAGYDSMVATHVATQHYPVKVYAVDTLVSADGWRDYVQSVANQMGWDFNIKDNPNPSWYAENALNHGFPYTRSLHSIMFRMLKERAIRLIKAEYKQDRGDKILFVTGIRRAESSARATAPEITVMGSGVFVSPLLYWSDEKLLEYRIENELPTNPFYETVGGSGDCQCNWGNFIDLETLETHSPQLAERIKPIHNECIKKHGYGWDTNPSKGLKSEIAGQLVLPGIEPLATPDLCAGCHRVKPKNEDVLIDRYMQDMEW